MAPWLTVLWHPAREAIGRCAALPSRLSRLEPEFAAPGAADTDDARAPLADPHLSRTAIALAALPGGGVRIAAPAIAELVVDGVPAGTVELAAADLARGVVLELAGRVALLLQLRRPPRPPRTAELVGASDAIDRLLDDIARVAALDAPVLIGGETGSGKEHVARAVHAQSGRATGPFVAINMATLAPAMAAAQLFGHVRGAFTGAERAHTGLFGEADGGTLFLDEIVDAPAEVQAMLLRTLETGEVRPVGGDAARRIDVRVLAASDADLADPAELRPQLYHRLAGARLTVPPLRDRPDDIGRLLAHFLARELAEPPAVAPGAAPWLPSDAIRAYVRHRWPGNVRELANLARHLAIHGRAAPIALGTALAPLTGTAAPLEPAPPLLPGGAPRDITDDALIDALARHAWRIAATAEALGISRTTLYALIDRCPGIRKARDLARDELEACRAAAGGDLDAMAAQLRVSRRGLLLRMRELGL